MPTRRIISKDKVGITATMARQRADKLFVEVTALSGDHDQIFLVETVRDTSSWREIHWRPFDMRQIKEEILIRFYGLAHEFECDIQFIVRDDQIQLVFFDNGES